MMSRLPVLLVAAGLLIFGAGNLLTADETRAAGAGSLLGAGLVLVGTWMWDELRGGSDDDDQDRR